MDESSGTGCQFNWLFKEEALRRTPSYKVGISPSQELTFRQKQAMLMQNIGQKSGLTQLAINTSVIFMHRFYMLRTVKFYPRIHAAIGFVFAAGKVEESARKLEHLIRFAVEILRINKSGEFLDKRDKLTYEMDCEWREKIETLCQNNCDVTSVAYDEMRKSVLECETEIYAVIGFQLQITHPHKFVIRMCGLLGAANRQPSPVNGSCTITLPSIRNGLGEKQLDDKIGNGENQLNNNGTDEHLHDVNPKKLDNLLFNPVVPLNQNNGTGENELGVVNCTGDNKTNGSDNVEHQTSVKKELNNKNGENTPDGGPEQYFRFIYPGLYIAENIKDISQYAYHLATVSSQLTLLNLKYKPELIATVCLNIASKAHSVKFMCMKDANVNWHQVYDPTTDIKDVEAVTEEFLGLIKGCQLLPSWMTNLARGQPRAGSRSQPGSARPPTSGHPHRPSIPSSTASSGGSHQHPPSSSSQSRDPSRHPQPPPSSLPNTGTDTSSNQSALSIPHSGDTGATSTTASASGPPTAVVPPLPHSQHHRDNRQLVPPGSSVNRSSAAPSGVAAAPSNSSRNHLQPQQHHHQQQQQQHHQRSHPASASSRSGSSISHHKSQQPPQPGSNRPQQPSLHSSSSSSSARPPSSSRQAPTNPMSSSSSSSASSGAGYPPRPDYPRRPDTVAQDSSNRRHQTQNNSEESNHHHSQQATHPTSIVDNQNISSHLSEASRLTAPPSPPSSLPVNTTTPPDSHGSLQSLPSDTDFLASPTDSNGSQSMLDAANKQKVSATQGPKLSLSSYRERFGNKTRPCQSSSSQNESITDDSGIQTAASEENYSSQDVNSLLVDSPNNNSNVSTPDLASSASFSVPQDSPTNARLKLKVKRETSSLATAAPPPSVKYADSGLKIKIKQPRMELMKDEESGGPGTSGLGTPVEEGEVFDSPSSTGSRSDGSLKIRLNISKRGDGEMNGSGDGLEHGGSGSSSGSHRSSHHKSGHKHHTHHHHKNKKHKYRHQEGKSSSKRSSDYYDERPSKSMRLDHSSQSSSSSLHGGSSSSSALLHHQDSGFSINDAFSSTMPNNIFDDEDDNSQSAPPPITPTPDMIQSSASHHRLYRQSSSSSSSSRKPPPSSSASLPPMNTMLEDNAIPPHHQRFHQIIAQHRANEAKKPPLPPLPAANQPPPPPPPPPPAF